jgi:RNA polymerase sigma factor (sigma-70 family)
VREATVAVDADELEVVYEEHGARLWRALLLYSGDPEVASDAVSEAFAQALRRGDAVVSVERWIWRSAFRIAAGELSRRSQQSELVDSATYEVMHETTELMLALPRLSSKQRRAIVLHYYGGYSLKEVATITGSTSSAVGVHLHRGRRRLRELLGDGDG